MDKGIVPVSGFGAINNFYGEGEVAFVKLPDDHISSDSKGESNIKKSRNEKRGNPQATENNNTKGHESGGGGTNFRSEAEFREYLTNSPQENVAATRAHIKDAVWVRQRDEAIANGDLPKSGFDGSERQVRAVVSNMLKQGKYKIIKSNRQDFRAVLTEPRLRGTVFYYEDDRNINWKTTETVRLSCSKEKGYHVYPIEEGDVK